jgi:DNA repair photolyase
MEEKKIYWGISKDLQADVRYEPNACRGYVMDVSLGCPNQCIYCLFSPLEMMAYRLYDSSYTSEIIPLKLDKFLAREKFPPFVYMCYASDPFGNARITQSTITVLEKLLAHGTYVGLVTKGIINDEVLEVMRKRPELIAVQVGITNTDDERNRIIEPGAPSYKERLDNIKRLQDIPNLGFLTVRIDPMLPLIDDTTENVEQILHDASSLGARESVIGYIILTRDMKNKLEKNPFTKESALALTEKAKTISQQELFSIPFEKKVEKLSEFEKICNRYGMKMAVCGCKEEEMKKTSFEWVCHPFNRERREEWASQTDFHLETSHFNLS